MSIWSRLTKWKPMEQFNEPDIVEGYTDREITDRVIKYMTTGENLALFNQCDRGEISREEFGERVKEHIRTVYLPEEEDVERIYEQFCRFMWGYYILDELIDDPDISDIRIIDPKQIYIKKLGQRYRTDLSFADDSDYDRFIERCVIRCHVNIGVQNSIQRWTDRTLEDWILRFDVGTKYISSNDNIIMHIRKHPKNKKLLGTLVKEGLLTDDMKEYIVERVRAGESFLICGSNAGGKTTLINAMIEEIPDKFSIFCVQEAEELFSMREREFMSFHTVEGKGDGKISYSLDEITRTLGLVTDIDIFMVGEIKGDEARDFLSAVHNGAICYGSVHSPSIEDAFVRIADYVKRTMDYSVEQIMYILRGMKNVIFLTKYRVIDIAQVSWDEDNRKLKFKYVFREREAVDEGTV